MSNVYYVMKNENVHFNKINSVIKKIDKSIDKIDS